MKSRIDGRTNGRGSLHAVPDVAPEAPVLITGGAGFIGANLADRLLAQGKAVILFDDLSRPGVRQNVQWLRERHRRRLQVLVEDIRDAGAVVSAVERCSSVFHLAAQVAVTSSVLDPLNDFEVNTRGTLNVLEAIRRRIDPPPLVFTSTNKVYGELQDIALRERDARYEPIDACLREHGIDEAQALDCHSPYGCSKAAADQYVIDYTRTYGIAAVVFRMSCIYGPHQFGTEDQGWVAHFLLHAMSGEPITVYGDGLQVRDLLFVDDLVDAFELTQTHMAALSGRAFNIGGGPGNAVSLLEVLDCIGRLPGVEAEVEFDDWRPGDQRYYVSNTNRFSALTGWRPRVGVWEGLEQLHRWLNDYVPMAPVLTATLER